MAVTGVQTCALPIWVTNAAKIAINKALEQKLIGPLEESHTEEQSPKAVVTPRM